MPIATNSHVRPMACCRVIFRMSNIRPSSKLRSDRNGNWVDTSGRPVQRSEFIAGAPFQRWGCSTGAPFRANIISRHTRAISEKTKWAPESAVRAKREAVGVSDLIGQKRRYPSWPFQYEINGGKHGHGYRQQCCRDNLGGSRAAILRRRRPHINPSHVGAYTSIFTDSHGGVLRPGSFGRSDSMGIAPDTTNDERAYNRRARVSPRNFPPAGVGSGDVVMLYGNPSAHGAIPAPFP